MSIFDLPSTRRDWLSRSGMGMAALGLAGLVDPVATSAAPTGAGYVNPMLPKAPHFTGKAKHVIHLFMNGGPSHVDTFDPKPSLEKYAGTLIFVSHDREFVSSLATRVLEIKDDGIVDFQGSYEDYLSTQGIE